MFSSLRRCVFSLLLLSLPALAAPRYEDRRAARIRRSSPPPEPAEVEPAEAAPMAAASADVGGVDLAGLLGMLTALAATYVYARGKRVAPESSRLRGSSGPR
jgi:hypothetical protein